MSQQRWHPLAPLTGIAFVVLALAGAIVGGETPGIEDTPQEVTDFYTDREGRTIFGAALLAWGTVFFIFFLGILRSVLRDGSEARDRLATVAFGGGIVMAAGSLSFSGFGFALADGADDLAPEAMQALNALSSDFFFLVAGGLSVLLVATAIASIRSGVLPAWLGWVALVLGIVAVTPLGFFALILFLVWTLIVSVLLWRSSGAPPAAPPPSV